MSDRQRMVEAGGAALSALGVGEIDTWDEDDIARVVVDAALAYLAANMDCLELSPESQQPCTLKANYEAHRAGHESAYVNSSRAVWATTEQDWWVRLFELERTG